MDLPVACGLEAGALGKRVARWQALPLIGTESTADGVRARFRREGDAEARLTELVAAERECCGFAEWQFVAEADELVLDVRSDASGGPAAVRELFAA
jgi:hypothetical protein